MATAQVVADASSEVADASSENEPAEKMTRLDPFITLLYNISQDIPEDKFQDLKCLCEGQKLIQVRPLGNITKPMHIFQELINQGKVSEDNPTLLVTLLKTIKLDGLASKLGHVPPCNQVKDTSGDFILTERKKKLIEFLKDLYKRHYSSVQPIPWNDDLKLELKDIYTRLEVREVRRGSAKVGKDLNNLHDIFKAPTEGERARRVRIEGPPAMGKSTLCRKLAYDWSCDKLDQFSLLFFLEMRHVSEGKVVDEILTQLLPKDTRISKTDLLDLIYQNEKSVLFLFDGLDELGESILEASDIADYINEKYYSWCTILITTRPRLCDKYLKECDLYLLVKGFSSENTEGYIRKYFHDSKETGEKLINEIKERKSEMSRKLIKDLLRNPLHISFLCILWAENKSDRKLHFPETLSALYWEILNCILKRYCTKKKITLDEQGEIPKSVLDDRNKLAFDSFEAYKADRSEFTENDISSKRSLELGFLVKDLGHSVVKVNKIYFFYHRTWLEFFAALQIAFSLQKGQIDILSTFLQKPNEHITLLKFLAGITDECECMLLFTEFNRLIQKGDSQSMPGVCLECVYESKYPEQIVSCIKNEPTLIYATFDFKGRYLNAQLFPSLIPASNLLVRKMDCSFDYVLHFMKLKESVIKNLIAMAPNQTEISKLSKTLRYNSFTLDSIAIILQVGERVVKVIDKLSDMIKDDKGHVRISSLIIALSFEGVTSLPSLTDCLNTLFRRIEENEVLTEITLQFYGYLQQTLKDITYNFLQICTKRITISYRNLYNDIILKDINPALQSINTQVKSLCLYDREYCAHNSETLAILSGNTTLTDISITVRFPELIHSVCDLIRRNTHALSLTFFISRTNSESEFESEIMAALRENKMLNHFSVIIKNSSDIECLMSSILIPMSRLMDSGQSKLTSIKASARGDSEKSEKITYMESEQPTKGEWFYEVKHTMDRIALGKRHLGNCVIFPSVSHRHTIQYRNNSGVHDK